jgi:phosphocarrier protein HPr
MIDPIRRHAVIVNPLGLHLRAAALFTQLARRFQAEVRVRCDGREVDGRSTLDLVTLAAGCGTTLEIEASGIDSEALLDALSDLIEAGFHEANI